MNRGLLKRKCTFRLKNLKLFLEDVLESVARIASGRLFQRRGAACEKALSP